MALAIQKLIVMGAISECKPQYDQFLSTIFLAPKPNGGHRFILNLKQLNKFIAKSHFKMEDHRTASKMIPRDGYMTTIDLRESYLLVPVSASYHKYLRFQFENENSQILTYEFNAMPYGLSAAPRTFTKIMKEVVSHLRYQGYKSVIYLDDILCIGNSYDECQKNTTETLSLLSCLGFVVNYEKSCLQPQQCCKYLGFMYNSIEMTIALPSDKRNSILQLIQKFYRLPTCTIREFAHLIGVLTSACPAVRYGWVYTKQIERQKYLALGVNNDNYDAKFKPNVDILPDLKWWINNVITTSNSITPPNFDIEIYTDASRTGWGAFCNNSRTGGGWTDSELEFHINYLELLAVFLGLKTYARDRYSCNILLRVDNTTAISYINRMGGIQYPHLNDLTKTIWQWCEKRNIWIYASYINTKDNVEADQESRKVNPDIEWQLSASQFRTVVTTFGEPTVDLFASRTNAKCKTYVSWRPDPDAMTVDAFTLNWKSMFFYAFPPFTMILKCLQKIVSDEAEGIFIFPHWPSQPWFPMLESLICSDVIYFSPELKSSPSYRTLQHHTRFTLGAALLSGRRSRQEAPRTKL